MKELRKLPSRLAEFRERDPAGFLEACRRGGRNAARKRKNLIKKKSSPVSDEIWEEILETLAMDAARIAAFQRRDHLLPKDD